ncbi:hypothetical protein GIB67_025025, partial [Kingdonia uniflora]
DLTMSSAEEEYDGTDDVLEFESDEDEGYVSQMQFLSGKKRKITYEELNVSTEPPPPLPQNYEPRNFRQLTQSDGKCHLFTSVATTSARVGFKCRSVLVKLRKMYLILIEVPHLKQKSKATNLMSLFDYKIGNSDNQVIVSMVERWWATTHTFHILCRELGITPTDFTVHTRTGIGIGEPMWYLGDRCWAQLEHRAVPYDPPEKLHCFLSPDVVRSLRAAGWIEVQHYIVGHHVNYDAYWKYVSHGALMSDIAMCGNNDIPGLGILTVRVTFPHLEFPTRDSLLRIHKFLPHSLKLTLDRTLDLEARHIHDESCIIHLMVDLRRAKGRLSQLNDYLDGEGIIVDWEDDEGEAETSQAGTSWRRGSRERRS